MRRLGSALKRAVTVSAVLALTLGMAAPATMSFKTLVCWPRSGQL